jgi:GNAT superfamily N-acetyltransferase
MPRPIFLPDFGMGRKSIDWPAILLGVGHISLLRLFSHSPELRDHGYGSQMLQHLRDTEHKVILEIDPLTNEQSIRRLHFYEHAGYTLTPYRFSLAYRLDAEPQELLIMSFPDMITNEQYNDFLNFIEERVTLYCEKEES